MADNISPESQQIELDALCRRFLPIIGENRNRDGLKDTPARFARGYLEMLKGYRQGDEYLEKIFDKTFDTDNNSMVIETGIPIYSFCEHHIVPFFGTCHIGYIPKKKVIGLSKLVKVADHFSRRLQIQEQLTEQIATTIADRLETDGVIVTMKCIHLCMFYRGVKEQVFATTSKVLGVFSDDSAARAEFLSLAGPMKVF